MKYYSIQRFSFRKICLKILCANCQPFCNILNVLTHWGRVTHICVSNLANIASDNGLSPGRRQAIIRTNAEMLLIRPLGTNFSEILMDILILSFKKMRLKVSSAKWRPFCLGLNVLSLFLLSADCVTCGLYKHMLPTNNVPILILFVNMMYSYSPVNRTRSWTW